MLTTGQKPGDGIDAVLKVNVKVNAVGNGELEALLTSTITASDCLAVDVVSFAETCCCDMVRITRLTDVVCLICDVRISRDAWRGGVSSQILRAGKMV